MTVPEDVMQSVYEEVRTPNKYGLVLVPGTNKSKMDCPTIFRRNNQWFMTCLSFNGRGYETWLAISEDLLDWEVSGRIMSFSDSADWDENQKAGYISLVDYHWGGTYELNRFEGKYWMSYFGENSTMYKSHVIPVDRKTPDFLSRQSSASTWQIGWTH